MNAHLFIRPIRSYIILFLLASLLTACSRAPVASTPTPATRLPTPVASSLTTTPATTPYSDYWPTVDWRTSSPEEQGMDSEKLTQVLAAIEQGNLLFHSLLVIRHGYLVSETYFGSYQQDTRHDLYSVTKSFVSTLIGIAMDQGSIDRLDQRVVDFFPGKTFANLDPQKQAMTLEDLLTMRSGLDWQEADPTFRAMYMSGDWVKFVLDEKMAASPGSQFHYCSGCSHVLSAILQKTTGTNTRAFADQVLFKPLGITNFSWDADGAGISIGGWGLQLTPRDMAKLGYLVLQDGQWDGQQIVSAGWVQNATQKHTGTDSSLGYGYQWWTYPSLGAYMALGKYGQTIFVAPGLDLVIVTTAQMENHDAIFQLIEQYIVPAVVE
jgi:CubicO group peptidase (beta-lactamase class C family)